jgi:opacity protein-like surface antigen
MKNILLAVLFVGFITSQVSAQESKFSLQYSVGFPTGDVKDFVDAVSWRGISIEYRYIMKPNIGIGLETGYNMFFKEMPYASYTEGTKTVTGKQFRYQHMVPILAAANYYFKPDETFNPFVGLGVGTLFSSRDVDMGMFTMENDGWQFVLRPEVGTLINTMNIDFILALKYVTAFKTDVINAQNYLTLNVGIVF